MTPSCKTQLAMIAILSACHGDKAPGPTDGAPPANHAPAITAFIDPELPTATDILNAFGANVDPDGDALEFSYVWTVDGAVYEASPPAMAGPFPKGSEIEVSITADDGTASATDSAFAVVVNSPPGSPVARIVASADADSPGVDRLRCEVATEASDVDADTLVYTVAWTVDGVAFAGETDVLDGDTIPAPDTARGSDWVCALSAWDGEVAGPVATASVHFDGPAPNQYAFEKVVDVPIPSDIAVLPDDTLLVSSLIGELYHVDVRSRTILSSTPLGEPDDAIGLTIDPRYGDGIHEFVYVWTARTCTLQRWHVDSLDPLLLSEEIDVVSAPCPVGTTGHCGGDVRFHGTVDGEPVLYLVTGPVGDLEQSDPDQPPGKLWAMTVTDEGVASPAFSSPFGDGWFVAMGLRNPWRIVDCGVGLCIPDPGTHDVEEVSYYDPAMATEGADFGFPACEGPCEIENPAYIEPFFSYTDDEDTWVHADLDGGDHAGFVNAPVAGVRLDDLALGGRLAGHLLVGDVYDGWVIGVPLDDSGIPTGDPTPLAHLPFLISMEELSDGTVVAAEFGGSIQQMILRADRAQIGAVGESLSNTTWTEGGIAYTPNYPLWSNGADKGRFIQVPAGETIDTTDPESWIYPVGTKLWKDFELDSQRAETRLIEKTSGGWVPAVYIWEGEEATLSNGFRTTIRLPDGTPYTVPSTQVCKDCHEGTRGSDWVLGVSALQLGDAGLVDFEEVVSTPVGPAPVIGGSPENRYARGYLQANCAMCHNPSGVTASTTVLQLDLRYDTPLAEMGLDESAFYYEANPNRDNGNLYVNPAAPGESVLSLVISNGDMPPVLTQVPDAESASRINDWIVNLTGY